MGCRRYTVHGHVQGVWFRASTREQAVRLGISGHAINLADGGVEVLACGTADALDTLGEWLQRGPDLARVDRVTCEPVGDSVQSGFTTG